MDLCPSRVIEKYRKYGFEYKSAYSNSSYLTFAYKIGPFHNAEIIKIGNSTEDKSDIDKKITSLQKTGYSPKIVSFKNINEIENELFQGFFDVVNWRKRVLNEYSEHVDSIMHSFPKDSDIQYSFINTPYTISNETDLDENSIVESVKSKLNQDDAQLILIEAPAGFGKTCTSYELIKDLADDNSQPIPFFTEFSRDRQARIFSHVFVREVDRAFSQVNSTVVEDELKNGRIVMVLDGFDELLSETHETSKEAVEDYENAEPMLETISDLLCKKAKIIITSRRSAVFDTATFNEWVDRYEDKFKFVRYRIQSPKIEDWLSEKRRALLEISGINLESISNPVLLSYLRFINSDKFSELCLEPNKIVSKYFFSMLEREKERQNLLMTPQDQTSLLTELAGDMCHRNYTSDTKEHITKFFKEKCSDLLENTRRLYSIRERPTLDSLTNTLSNHAFFDRSNQGESRIEFINEFVFGNYIAENILCCDGEWLADDERFVEPAVSSYIPRTSSEKEKLWNKLDSMVEFLSTSEILKYEIAMLGNIYRDYSNSSVMSMHFERIGFFEHKSVSEITFSDCIFSNVNFFVDNISNPTFINCKFYSCEIYGDLENTSSYLFLSCDDNNQFIEKIENHETSNNEDVIDELTKLILERFWKIGSPNIDRLHIPLASVFKSGQAQSFSKRQITLEIKKLKKLGVLTNADSAEYIAIDKSEIVRVKSMLGRI